MTTSAEWTSGRVRETFLSFFEERGHRRVASSSLVPAEDPTLLFTNAGMNQFKDVFLGRESRDYARATTAQKCVRAGGKHNDLDNVGYTARHHTFFEMLGNFSFGDYFKAEAIDYAWELVTGQAYYGLDPARLWATVYTDDDEAAALWAKYLPKERIVRFGEKDNFWSMGETGPCGPCSELHYDQGPSVPGDDRPNGEGDRVVEIWNLVFMQFDRDASGRVTPLPKPSVDTGAGLERITAILSGKTNNFDTDLFAGTLARLERLSGHRYRGGMAVEDAPFRVIADHVRAATMLMADGTLPGNEGRGYVLRRILRRAIRYGRRLGLADPFLDAFVEDVLAGFAGVYFASAAEASDAARRIRPTVHDEEVRFGRTMSTGADRVGEAISDLRRRGESVLEGETVFRFYDTYGIPLDLIEELALDEGVRVDREGFEVELEAARERSKAGSKFQAEEEALPEDEVDPSWTTEFRGYPEDDFVSLDEARVLGLFRLHVEGGRAGRVHTLPAGTEGVVVTDRSVFYPEGGGQVTDQGDLRWPGGHARVTDVRKGPGGRFLQHRVRVEAGSLAPGTVVSMEIDEWTRRRTQANHTGTHLLHAALRRVLGDSVRQMGSLVAPDRLRFDYTASRPTTGAELVEIERLVNEEVLRDRPVTKAVVSMDEAKARGALMFFGEKYGERVRVVDVPGFSTELCGGCHVGRTGEVGAFKVLSDRGLAAGVRRVEAVTSIGALERFSRAEELLSRASEAVQATPEELPAKVRELAQRMKEHEKEVARLKVALATASGPSSSGAAEEGIEEVEGVKVLARRVPSLPLNELRNLADTFRGKLGSGVVLLGTDLEGKVTLLAAVTPDLTGRVPAGDLAQVMAPVVGGRGGGRPDLAQAGGKDADKLPEALRAGVERARALLTAG
ncbi:alanine--tRNA ligase [Acidobacteria bacterium ACD]|nr:MAG: alanine--tRNA ligase [Acidobacteriota bacterium]MDL1949812.1 alanine--tRNA ligase [Acidobacteria bacterium ACD]